MTFDYKNCKFIMHTFKIYCKLLIFQWKIIKKQTGISQPTKYKRA